jgi:hypothetical protein
MSERHSPRRVGTGNPGADDVTNQSAHVISFRSLFQLTAINPAVRPNAKVQLTRMAKKRRNGAPIVAALQPAPFSISAKQRETRQSECPLWVITHIGMRTRHVRFILKADVWARDLP